MVFWRKLHYIFAIIMSVRTTDTGQIQSSNPSDRD